MDMTAFAQPYPLWLHIEFIGPDGRCAVALIVGWQPAGFNDPHHPEYSRYYPVIAEEDIAIPWIKRYQCPDSKTLVTFHAQPYHTGGCHHCANAGRYPGDNQ